MRSLPSPTRGTGGRFNEKGALIDSDGPATAFLRWLDARLQPTDTVELHEGMKPTWAQVWSLGGRVVGASRPLPKTPAPIESSAYLVDTRFLLDPAQEDLAARFRVVAVGPFWHVDRSARGSIEAFAIRESEPSWLTWYLVSGTEPVRTIEPDPLLTWELRAHFRQAADLPDLDTRPATFDQRLTLHNAALTAGDQARAQALFAEIQATLSPPRARFDDGTELIGVRYVDGACPDLVLVLRAAGPTPPDVQLTVRSQVVTERAHALHDDGRSDGARGGAAAPDRARTLEAGIPLRGPRADPEAPGPRDVRRVVLVAPARTRSRSPPTEDESWRC